jgi:hypothetical protein
MLIDVCKRVLKPGCHKYLFTYNIFLKESYMSISRKKGVSGKFFSMLIVVAAACSLFADQPPAEVQTAAQSGLSGLLGSIKPNMLEVFNFSATDNLKECTLGEPFQLRDVSSAAIEKYSAGTSAASMMTETTLWYFPVYCNNELKIFLLVDKVNGVFQAASLGYAPLAVKFRSILSQFPRAKGFHHVLSMNFQTQKYMISIPEESATNLTPLTISTGSTGTSLKKSSSSASAGSELLQLQDVSQTVNELRPLIKTAR